MKIGADSSVIIALWGVQPLDLLRLLFGEIFIPPAVATEIDVQGKSGYKEFTSIEWIKQIGVLDSGLVDQLTRGAVRSTRLDQGESEVIALAVELVADALLIDERRGRSVALHLGIPVTGVVGILLQAKQLEFIHEVRPLLDQLVNEAGFRLKNNLYHRVLELAGETAG